MRELRAVRSGSRKLILPSRGDPEVYDLAADPLEKVDLFATRPELAATLGAELERALGTYRVSSGGPGSAPVLTPEQREALEALGYTEDAGR
jgi:hypothetical protein